MRLYIVRHAIAIPRGTQGVTDEDRTLTEEGIQKMKKAAAGMRALGCIPDLILSSPLVRAKQTADILFEAFGKGIELKVIQALAPAGSRPELYRDVGAYRKLASLMLVGHQPSLGEIAGAIAWGSPEYCLELKKGGACAIELKSLAPAPRGTLLWLLTPSILRQVVQ